MKYKTSDEQKQKTVMKGRKTWFVKRSFTGTWNEDAWRREEKPFDASPPVLGGHFVSGRAEPMCREKVHSLRVMFQRWLGPEHAFKRLPWRSLGARCSTAQAGWMGASLELTTLAAECGALLGKGGRRVATAMSIALKGQFADLVAKPSVNGEAQATLEGRAGMLPG